MSDSPPMDWARSVAEKTGADEIRANSIPEGKMSDVVAEYAAPLLDEFGEFDEDIVKVLDLACLFWNLSLSHSLSGNTDREIEHDLMQILYRDPYFLSPAGALNLIGDMIKRWDLDYSWYRRLIVDKKIELRDQGPYISIVSAPIDDLDTLSKAE